MNPCSDLFLIRKQILWRFKCHMSKWHIMTHAQSCLQVNKKRNHAILNRIQGNHKKCLVRQNNIWDPNRLLGSDTGRCRLINRHWGPIQWTLGFDTKRWSPIQDAGVRHIGHTDPTLDSSFYPIRWTHESQWVDAWIRQIDAGSKRVDPVDQTSVCPHD